MKEDYIKWYKLARSTVSNSELVPKRTDSDIVNNQISVRPGRDNWLNISPAKSTLEASLSQNPNIFFSIHEDNEGSIGVVFNSAKSMDKIKNILNGVCTKQKKELISILKKLDDSWETTLYKKIKEHHPRQSPEYYLEYTIESKTIDDKVINKLFNLSQIIRQEGKTKSEKIKITKDEYYSETPKLNLIECDFHLTEKEFKKRILIAHQVLGICYQVKTDSQIKRITEKSRRI